MALSRSFLRGLQLNDEQISAIIEAHAETVDGLKSVQSELQTKLDAANTDLESIRTGDFERKYNELNSQFEKFKADTAERETHARKVDAYTNLLRENGVSDKRINGIIRYDSDAVDSIEFNDDGTIKDAGNLSENIKTNWSDFITVSSERGAPVQTPPSADAKRITREDIKTMTPAEINANWTEVQNALKGN